MAKPRLEQEIYVGLIGCGTVGSGVVDGFYQRRLSPGVVLKTVAVEDLSKPRNCTFPQGTILTGNALEIIEDPKISIVVEVMGGTDKASEYVKSALRDGKHVVTANKVLLGQDLPELFDLTRESGSSLSFEASVCGAIPVIRTLQEYLKVQRINSVKGIVNGTTNYILTEMEERNLDLDIALKQAQELGYAEKDPTDDIEGYDARSKLSVIASIASGTHIRPQDIPCWGITNIKIEDILLEKKRDRAYKLIALAYRDPNNLWHAKVAPSIVDKDDPLRCIRGVFNALTIEADLAGPLTLIGRGAGKKPTSGAVLADILHAASHARYGIPDILPEIKRQEAKEAVLV